LFTVVSNAFSLSDIGLNVRKSGFIAAKNGQVQQSLLENNLLLQLACQAVLLGYCPPTQTIVKEMFCNLANQQKRKFN